MAEVSLQPSADAIDYGADAVFKGTVIRPDSTAGAGEAVALQKRGTRRRLGDGRRAPRRWSTARGSCACRGDAAATCAPWPPG